MRIITNWLRFDEKILLVLCGLTGGIFLTGCASFSFPYRPDIQQGNIITSKTIARLHPGMSQHEVIFLLGSPLLRDPFHPERWDYFYSLKTAGTKLVQRRATLYFHDQQLERITIEPGI